MHHRLALHIIYIVLFFLPVISTGQTIREISKEPGDFPEELERMVNTIRDRDTRKQSEEFAHYFTMLWDSDTLKTTQKETVIETINTLLSKRYRIDPVIMDYLNTIRLLSRREAFDQDFKEVQSGLTYIMDRQSRSKVREVLETLLSLMESGYLTTYNSSTWETASQVYNFTYDAKSREFKVEIPKTDLIAHAYDDSSMLYNTGGYFDIVRERWHGEGGIVTWENAGHDPDVIYAQLNEYSINMRFTKYVVEKVNFFHKEYLNEPLIGRLTNQTETGVSSGRVNKINYPRFVSAEGQTTIKDIFPDIDYRGGFSMRGDKLAASGSGSGKAAIIVNRGGKPFIKLKSNDFALDSNRIVSPEASMVIFLEEDSVYHPAIRFTYENDRNLISIYREEEGLSQSPFYDSYHMVDIRVEAIFWNMKQEKMRFQNMPSASGKSLASFRSMDFFDEREFDRIKGYDKKNPLYYIRDFHKRTGKKDFTLEEMTNFVGYAPHMVKSMLLKLANQGFLIYNLDNDKVKIRERLFMYLNARHGKTDYDVISFRSSTRKQSNAELSLLDNTIKLFGVRSIQLSDSQNVAIQPENDTLILKKNRDFDFGGIVKAGRFVIHGTKFQFSYENFRIEMPLVDSLEFWVKPFKEDEDKYAERKYVESVIQEMKGKLLIDDPGNKAGLESYPRYPVLNSEENSFVYYDRHSKYPKTYNSDEFYYRIEPFTIDSLNTFSTENLEFDGYLASAGIFPVIEHPLSVQRDYSLGFIHQSPPAGYTAYGGKGHYNEQIMLSNKGLQGNGSLKYISSLAKSKEFTFFPDSTNGIAYSYNVEPQKGQVEYPSVEGENVYLHWEPHNDLMTIESREEAFNMYEDQANMEGTLHYTPEEMTGSGLQQIADAKIDSRLFEYKNQVINADTCNFKLQAMESEFGLGAGDKVEQDLITSNYRAMISFEDRKGEFVSNSGASQVRFPVNQYMGYIDMFTWFMDKEEIAFSTEVSKTLAEGYDKLSKEQLVDTTLKGARFVSLHPNQDSLDFIADQATYSREEQSIKSEGVRIIHIADAAIFPEDQQLTIRRKAEIEQLKNSEILANTTTRFHWIQDAIVSINGHRDYNGRGNYEYKDKNDKIQTIYLHEIYVDSTFMTNARGEITQEDKFTLSPAFNYKGNVNLLSTRKHLVFDGGFQIRNYCDTVQHQWVGFTSVINPDSVMIPVDSNMKTMSKNETYASIRYAQGQKQIYSTFFGYDNTPRQRMGNTLFSSTGLLIFDEISSEYRILPEEKLKEKDLPGNVTSYNTRNCIHFGEGRINFYEETGQVDLNTIGKIEHDISADKTEINAILAIDFFFEDEALEYMAKSINDYSDLKGVELNTQSFNQAIIELLGKEEGDEVVSDISVYNKIQNMPDNLKHTMLLTGVSLEWNSRIESFISEGPVGIAYLGDNQVTKYVDAYIVFSKGRRSGFNNGEFTILLEISSAEWYFFNYKPRGSMTVVGGSDDFKDIINELSSDDRTMDTPSSETSFRYHLGGSAQREQFLKNFKRLTEER
ncbi:MAG: hypothetical protein R6U19_10470 [Bacteroidales bacterium]